MRIWDPNKKVTVQYETMIHDDVGFTPYEGRHLTGWPETVLSRGRVVIENATLCAQPGSGLFLDCAKPDSAIPTGRLHPEANPAENGGARLI